MNSGVEIGTLTLKFVCKMKDRIAKTTLKKKKKNKLGWLTLANFKVYYKTIVINSGILALR